MKSRCCKFAVFLRIITVQHLSFCVCVCVCVPSACTQTLNGCSQNYKDSFKLILNGRPLKHGVPLKNATVHLLISEKWEVKPSVKEAHPSVSECGKCAASESIRWHKIKKMGNV